MVRTPFLAANIRRMYMRYAVIQDHVCVNIVVSDETFATERGFVALPDGFGIGDRYIDGVWQKA